MMMVFGVLCLVAAVLLICIATTAGWSQADLWLYGTALCLALMASLSFGILARRGRSSGTSFPPGWEPTGVPSPLRPDSPALAAGAEADAEDGAVL